ncbi:venom acid phosphatase Acph-1-like [Leptopilina heterotoma]|uniref:venom acid phosphatase Acph-1-like n=1 Tax=Leptopilina heterotoma TaxID=63436 RepID=UPI001CA92AB0|nr:venom acid phosphatase Acph-1-like [Leptopilina heterotoma]
MYRLVSTFYMMGSLLVQSPLETEDQDSLKQVSVVFRHGDRTPILPLETYPNDPYINHTFSDVPFAILTESGKQRAYRLGEYLKTTYSKFLNNKFTPYTVETRSTNANRTKETLNFVLKALNSNIKFPNIIAKPVSNDSLLITCDEYLLEFLKVQNKMNGKYGLNFQRLMNSLTDYTGKNITRALDLHALYTTFETEKYHNLTLPSWTKVLYPDGLLVKGCALSYKLLNYDDNMKKLNGGMLIRKFINDMLAVKNGEIGKKLFLYSAHDITVVAVLQALGVYFSHVPKFTSATILELHQIKGDYFIKLVYYLGVPEETMDLTIPNCKTMCPLEDFIRLVENVLPKELTHFCSPLELKEEDMIYKPTLLKFKKLMELSIVSSCFVASESTLQFINVVFRHADRTPIPPYEMYPNDPYKNLTTDPSEYGQLTKSGEIRAFRLGGILCDKYCEFLGTNYQSGTIEARSTDFNRTKESLNLLLKALYPGNIIETTYQPLENDTLLFPLFCKLFTDKYSQVQNMTEVKTKASEFDEFEKQLSIFTGKEIKSLHDVALIWVTLETENFMGLQLPEWTRNIYPNGDILDAVIEFYKIMNYNAKLRRLNGGMLVRKFIEDIETVVNGTNKHRKLMLYSAHDITIAGVLSALNVFYPHAPQFSSAVIVELHLINKIYYIKILYYLGQPETIRVLRIPKCGELCPLNRFKNLVKKNIPNDFETKCGRI